MLSVLTSTWYDTVFRMVLQLACEYTVQIVLRTLDHNLQMCTHFHGLDAVFDVEACIAHVAHILNITCTDQVNVSADLMLSIAFLCHVL